MWNVECQMTEAVISIHHSTFCISHCVAAVSEENRYTWNDVPQPQVLFAFGFWKTNPLLIRLVS
jgi:hypothetical protein